MVALEADIEKTRRGENYLRSQPSACNVLAPIHSAHDPGTATTCIDPANLYPTLSPDGAHPRRTVPSPATTAFLCRKSFSLSKIIMATL